MSDILLLNGPNLNLLGTREPDIYGQQSLDDITEKLIGEAAVMGLALIAYQSNAEHDLVNKIHEGQEKGIKFIVINPGALTHTSVSLRDALLGVGIPFIEVHISNIYAREEFRQNSLISKVATGIIGGFGDFGYLLALQAVLEILVRKGN